VIEDLNKPVEARLLQQEVGRDWLGGFFLKSEVHAFVTALEAVFTRLSTLRIIASRACPQLP